MKYYLKAILYVLLYSIAAALMMALTAIVAVILCKLAQHFGMLGWFTILWNIALIIFMGFLIAGYSGKLDRK